MDAFGDPAFPLRKEKAGFSKNNVVTGDTLILKDTKSLTVDDTLNLGVSMTTSGLHDDCIFLGDIKANKDCKLSDLKDMITTMDYFKERQPPTECVRLREKLNNQFFGKIYRDDGNKTIKNLGIKNKG